jgi:hypothetical protein
MRLCWVGMLLLSASAAEAAETRSTPKLLPAPWADQEALTLAEVPRSDAAKRGTTLRRTRVHVAVRGEAGGWSLRSHEILNSSYTTTLGGVAAVGTSRRIEVDAETLFPSSFQMHRTGRATDTVARFADGRVEVTGLRATPRAYDLEDAAFDDSEIPFVLRRLPLEVGHPLEFSVFAGALGVYPVKVVPVARETLTVPAGTFECVKVEVQEEAARASRATVHMPGMTVETPREHFYWISTDAHRYLVKEDDSGTVSELVKVSRWDRETTWSFDDGTWKVALTTPPGWTAQPLAPAEKPWIRTMAVMSGDGEVVCSGRFENFLLMLKDPPREPPVGWRPEKARAYAERELKGMTRMISDNTYVARDASWSEATVDGSSAARYVADYKMRSRELVGQLQYVNQPIRAVFSCFTPSAAFDARKGEILALMDSQRLN